MALIKCPECNKDISNIAKTCPHCGVNVREYHKVHKKTNWLKTIIVCCLIFAIFVVILINYFTDWMKPAKVTFDEFEQIHKGMTYEQVCSIVGDDYTGMRHRPNEYTLYTYDGVGDKGCEVFIYFVNNKVEWKQHTGLHGGGLSKGMKLY